MSDIIRNRFVFFNKEASFNRALLNQLISLDSVVFIKDSAKIWTHGTFFSGGGGSGPAAPIDISETPMYYYRPSTSTAEYDDLSLYTVVNELTASYQLSISLLNKFLFLAVPDGFRVTRVITSRYEELDLNENFEKDSTTMSGKTIWKYLPVVAPENLTLTFTFSMS